MCNQYNKQIPLHFSYAVHWCIAEYLWSVVFIIFIWRLFYVFLVLIVRLLRWNENILFYSILLYGWRVHMTNI